MNRLNSYRIEIQEIFIKWHFYFRAIIVFIFHGFVEWLLYRCFIFLLLGPVRKTFIFRKSWTGQRGKYLINWNKYRGLRQF